jgi:hypothetical protein
LGYALMYGRCINCKNVFTFNPLRVPSVRIKNQREPVCSPCMVKVNTHRKNNGQKPFHIHSDAYDSVDENELP